MKRIVLVAPGARPPLTEGRKLYVTDLAGELRRRGFAVEIADGGPYFDGARGIWKSVRQLEAFCSQWKVDAVAVFPYGKFSGSRRFANHWLLRKAQEISRRNGVRALPVFYSCAGISIDEIAEKYTPALAMGRSRAGVGNLHLGISRHIPFWAPKREIMRDILYLCGYQKPTQRALDDVLNDRGLIDLLRAGNEIADAGLKLTIAIPFLESSVMRDRMQSLAAKICPRLPIDLRDSVDPADIFGQHDAFVFPYRAPHAVFIPTSLLEAMYAGIPVVAANQVMYGALTSSGCIPRCGLHRIGDHGDLAHQLLAMKDNYGQAIVRAEKESILIRREWSIETSADELVAAFSSAVPARH